MAGIGRHASPPAAKAHQSKGTRLSIKKSLAWMGTAQVCMIALQFASSVVLARYLTPYEMGICAAAMATVGLLAIFQQLGLPSLIVRERVVTDELERTVFTVNAVVTILLSLTILLASFGGAALLRDARVGHVMAVLAIYPLFGIPSFLPATYLERAARFKEMALAGVMANIAVAVTSITLVVHGHSYMSIAFAQVAGGALLSLFLVIFGREHFRFPFGLKAWRRTTEFGVLSVAVTGVGNLSQRISELALGRFLGLAPVGLFNRANALNLLVWNNVHSLISRVLLVDFAALHREGISLRERYKQTIAMVTATLWPAFAGLAVIAKSFIFILYGARWLPATRPFIYLAIASLIQVSVTMTPELFAITDRLRTQTRIEVTRAIFGTVAFLGACLISLEAAAATRILETTLAWFLYRPHLNRMTDTSFDELKGVYAQSAILTLVAIAPAGFMVLRSPDRLLSLLDLLGAIGLGVILWLVALFVLRHPLSLEARDMWNRKVRLAQ